MIPQKDRIEAAIRHIQTASDVDPWAMELAVDALEKQIPKKPYMVTDVYVKNLYTMYCPVCATKLGNGNSRVGYTDIYNKSGAICGCCGQAIDWGMRNDQRRSYQRTNVCEARGYGGQLY